MIQKNNSVQTDDLIKPDTNHAQILIEVDSEIFTIEKAKEIIEELGVQIIEVKNLSSQWVLLKLDIKDMREIALKLTENGFFKIKGINASAFDSYF
jgi:hypothetical protein